MSDPVTNAEIEDVLSSIRRLVAGESAPQRRAGVDPEPEAPSEPALVLTPEQRLTEDAGAEAWDADAEEDAAAAREAHDPARTDAKPESAPEPAGSATSGM